MALLRRVARPMLASMYIVGGIDTLRTAKDKAPLVEPVVQRISDALPEQAPKDTVTLVRIDGAVKTGAGALLAIGKFPRLAALALAGSTVPTTVAAHAFWQESDPAVRAQQKVHFFKNLSMLGGLLIAAADTAGKPSLGYRARRAVGHVGGRAQGAASTASDRAHDAAGGVRGVAGHVKESLPG